MNRVNRGTRESRRLQLSFFPLVDTAVSITEVGSNIALSKEHHRNYGFNVDLGDPNKFHVNGRGAPNTIDWVFKFLSEVCVGKIQPTCSQCHREQIVFFMQCHCGTYIWCRKHFDREVFWDHYLHYCSRSCCRRFHSQSDIRRPKSDIDVLLSGEEISASVLGPGKIFLKVRLRTELEINRQRAWLSSYASK